MNERQQDRIEELEAQLRQEREAHAETKRELNAVGSTYDLLREAAAKTGEKVVQLQATSNTLSGALEELCDGIEGGGGTDGNGDTFDLTRAIAALASITQNPEEEANPCHKCHNNSTLRATISTLRRHLDSVQSCGECSICRWHDYSPDEDAALAQKPEEEAKP